MEVRLEDIKPSQNYSRPHGVGDITELVESMKEHGQLMPVTLSCDGFLAMGHRRFAAAKSLGWETLRVEVSEKSIEELKAANLVENICRKGLSLWEEISGIREVFGPEPNISEIQRKTSKSRNWVRPRVEVWTLPQDFIDQIRLNQIDIGQLRARLYGRKEPSLRVNFNVRPTENQVRDAMSRLVEQGRTAEARALSYSIGTVTFEQLTGLQPD